jgi:hypothetical protein
MSSLWGRGRSTGRSVLLRVCVYSQLHYTHQQLLQYTGSLPTAHRIETMATVRDPRSKLFVLSFSLSFYCLLLTVRVFCLPKHVALVIVISSGAYRKFGHKIVSIDYVTRKEFPLQFLKVSERNFGGSSFWILRNGGITDQRR